MNKAAIKNFAVWARKKLIADITYKAGMLGITESGIAKPLKQSTSDLQLFDIGTRDYATISGKEILQRDALVSAINAKEAATDHTSAFRFIVEKVAYTWFNRLVAIRFMEVNGYLPSRIRVLSSEIPSKAEPDFVTTPFYTDLTFTDAERNQVMKLKDENRLDELFRMLFIKQCNKLNDILPDLFEKTEDFTELLLTISFTDSDGVVWHLIKDIPEDDFNIEKEGQVEIIGWMYQYYNTENNELVYDGTLSKSKIPKELLSAATTIYTPDWAVRYMVENSLGRLWVEGHPDEDIKRNWKYYLEEAEQEPDVQKQLAQIREEYKTIKPEDIRCIDPCMGSGHILCYLFDVLMQIYKSQGWMQGEAAQAICKYNLFGLDIDDRAAQLAYFAVMMKGQQYDRRFLTRGIRPRVYSIQESNDIKNTHLQLLEGGLSSLERNNAYNQIKELLDMLFDAKEYGSILNVKELDWVLLRRYVEHSLDEAQISVESFGLEETQAKLKQLIDIGEVMAQKYNVVVTNPPYVGSSRFSPKLDEFVKEYYADTKSDLSMVMFRNAVEFMGLKNGFVAFITTSSWMFLSSFQKLRTYLFCNASISNIVDFGTELFEGKVGHNPIVSWVTRNSRITYKLTAVRLVDYCYSRRDEKQPEFFENRNRYTAQQDNFSRIPGTPVAYWLSSKMIDSFSMTKLYAHGSARQGLITGDNNRFLRLWHEVSFVRIGFSFGNRILAEQSVYKWFPYNKGGDFRKWYGNNNYVVNWEQGGNEIQHFTDGNGKLRSRPQNIDYYFLPGFTWSDITLGQFSARIVVKGFIHDSTGPKFFPQNSSEEVLLYYSAAVNSKPVFEQLKLLAPTFHFREGPVSSVSIPENCAAMNEVISKSRECLLLSRIDWDSFEISWDFQRHPILQRGFSCLEGAFTDWQLECENRFCKLKVNEEALNRIFIDIYGLQEELEPEVVDKDVTVRRANLRREIRSLISYAVGCMFGRYSLDTPGLAYAGGEWDAGKYSSFIPDYDNCIPITDEAYFEDDIVGRFCQWLKVAFAAETLEENLDFIARVLDSPGTTSRDVIRNYFLNEFFKDHCSSYSVTGSGKRPIYWLFDSGNQNSFKALVYMHRWNADTVGNLRVEYLHRLQRVYEHEIEHMQETMDNSRNPREVAAASKRREKLVKQLKEARDYDAKIAHVALSRVTIDLDDGVKVNYEKVQAGPGGKSLDILAKI